NWRDDGAPYGDSHLDREDRGLQEFGVPHDYGFHPHDDEFEPHYRHWRDQQLRQHDDEYHRWRSEQQKSYDDEYRAWRDDRRKSFGQTFSQWREQRSKEHGHSAAPQGAVGQNPDPVKSVTDGQDGKTD
ncbi:MAG TPA: hypothetical protein VIO94_05410, partial [Phenylobacterium sp.]